MYLLERQHDRHYLAIAELNFMNYPRLKLG